jgi:hypothetical protein
MYAWATHGAKCKHIGETMGHEDSGHELEVISFQGVYISSQVMTILLFRNFLSLLIYVSTLPVLLSITILLFYKVEPIGLNTTEMELQLQITYHLF